MLISGKFNFWWQYWFCLAKSFPSSESLWIIYWAIGSNLENFGASTTPHFLPHSKACVISSKATILFEWVTRNFRTKESFLEEIADTVRPWPKSDCTRNNDRRMQIMNNPRLLIKEIWPFTRVKQRISFSGLQNQKPIY